MKRIDTFGNNARTVLGIKPKVKPEIPLEPVMRHHKQVPGVMADPIVSKGFRNHGR